MQHIRLILGNAIRSLYQNTRWLSVALLIPVLFACSAMQPKPPLDDTLFKAVMRNDILAVEAFIAAGENINARNSDGRSPLYIATMQNKADMVRFLIQRGADTKTPYRFGERILHVAVERDAVSVVPILLDAHVELDPRNQRGETPFFIAGKLGRKSAPILLQAGADVNARDNEKATPLIAAASICQLESIQMLLKADADINAADENGNTALTRAAGIPRTFVRSTKMDEANVTAVVAELLGAGANVKARIKHQGENALLLAVKEGHADVTRLLIQARSDVNVATTIDRFTPLMEAAKAGYADIANQLLAAGADPKRKDRIGRDAIAWSADYPEITRMLGGKPVVAKPGRAATPDPVQKKQAQETLFKLGYREFTESMFVMSAHQGDIRAAKAFLAYGLAVDSKDSDHVTTPLLAAAMTPDSPELGLFLIAAGANVNVTDENGSSALLWASEKCTKGELVKALIAAGANVNAKAAGGATPLMMAELNKCSESVRLLKKAGAKK